MASGPGFTLGFQLPPRISAPGSPVVAAPTRHWRSPVGLTPALHVAHTPPDACGSQSATHSQTFPTRSNAPRADLQLLREPVFTVGELRVDLGHRRVYVANQEVHLTPIEYKLLTVLVRYAGRVVTQRQLLQEVWGPHQTSTTHYVRVYMGQLRHKLEANPARPRYLVTEPGVGYRLKTDE